MIWKGKIAEAKDDPAYDGSIPASIVRDYLADPGRLRREACAAIHGPADSEVKHECRACEKTTTRPCDMCGESIVAMRHSDLQALQAKIDWLMLEYCPDEMTPEQIEEWGKHQVPSEIKRRLKGAAKR